MTSITVQLSDREIEALKARTGKRDAEAALKAWAARADLKRSSAKLRAALKESMRRLERVGALGAHARRCVGSRADRSAALQARLQTRSQA
jgi:hypothetical protein